MHQRQYIIGIVAVMIANAVVLLPAYFIRLTIDGLTRALDRDPATVGITAAQAGQYALGMVGASLVSVVDAGTSIGARRRNGRMIIKLSGRSGLYV